MNTDTKSRQAYICNEDFIVNVDGVDKHYREGISRVYEGDPILDRCPALFDIAEDYEAQHRA
jgi:hypothetical protein